MIFWETQRPLMSLMLVALLAAGVALTCSTSIHAEDATTDGTAAVDETPTDEAATTEETAPADPVSELADNANILWVCLAAFLVFFMQAGFALVECGFTRAKNACNIIMKNLMDLSMGSIAFWMVGFGLMFGVASATKGFLGLDEFFFDAGDSGFNWAFILFQTVFAATAATIVSGAMAERTKFVGYLIYSVAICVIVYPVFGKWAWGSLLIDDAAHAGWLSNMGFLDFAGSTVVHSIGGWAALAGAIVIGPRLGKYSKDGKTLPIPAHNIPLGALGVFILWLGWFGFNAGSTVALGGDLARIAFVTNLSAAGGAIAALITSWILFKKPDPTFALNGALAGLVGITAGCDVIGPPLAVLTGAIAGVIVVFACVMFDKLKIDDPVGAISVHGVCGAWGTLAVGLFMAEGGLFLGGGVSQLVTQLIGVAAAFCWAFPVSLGIFLAIKYTVGLRVSPAEETEGLDITEHGILAYPPNIVSDTYAGTPTGKPFMPTAAASGTPAVSSVASPEGA